VRNLPGLTLEITRPDEDEAALLIAELDAFLQPIYPPESQHGLGIEALCAPHITFFLARHGRDAVGCGGLKRFDDYGELSRFYVRPQARGQGIARAILERVEGLARECGLGVMRLESGNRQPEALALYHSAGYRTRGPFGSYASHPNCIFMEKML